MNKMLALLLVVGILFSMVGCGGVQEPSQSTNMNQQNNNQYTTTQKQPTETILTVDNIEDYLSFTCNVSDVQTEKEYGLSQGDGKLTIKTFPKKRGEFVDVVILVMEKRTGAGWEKYPAQRTLEIPFDGKFEKTFDISTTVFDGGYLSETPSVTLEMKIVSGKFVEQ